MGTVWGAYDEVLGRDVAVKEVVLPFGLTDEERDTQYKRTFREARTAARLGHPGVIAVYDVVEEDERPWIVMELVRARSLDKVIKQDGVLDWPRAAEIGRQMLAALHAAHEAGVLHRDVKPSNVLLDETPSGERAVLTDFGIATSVGDSTLTTTGLVLGSPAYIAPERARGKQVGPASDLWSLGVTLYAMLNGRSPFERQEPMASLVAIISDEPEYLEQAGPLWPVIEGLLCKDPDRRLTAHQAALVLDDLVRTQAVASNFTEILPVQGGDPAATVVEPVEPPEQGDGKAVMVTRAEGLPLPAAAEASPVAEKTPAAEKTSATQKPAAVERTGENPQAPDTVRVSRAGAQVPNRKALMWAVAGLVVVMVVGAAVALAGAGGGGSKHPKKAVKTPAKSSAPPSATPSPSFAAFSIPAGFKEYDDDTGFKTVVPSGWDIPPRRGDGTEVVASPDNSNTRVTFQTEDGSGSALDTVRNFDTGYQASVNKLSSGPVTTGPYGDRTGAKAAQMQYTWQADSGQNHVLVQDFNLHGHNYQIIIQSSAGTWDSTLRQLQPVLDEFRLK
jgi:hypothetical protein